MPPITQTIAMLNNIRDNASTEYTTRVPLATRDNITAVGNAITTYTPILNEFVNTLIGKIALTIVSSKLFTNRLAPFKSGELLTGSDVEEIFVEMVSGVNFDETGANPLGRRKPTNVSVLFHRQNRQDAYEISVSDEQVKMAFRSYAGVSELTASLIQAMYSGANYDEYVLMKNLLATYAGYATYETPPITDQATAKDFVKTVNKAYQDSLFPRKDLNGAGVRTWCEEGQCTLFVNKDVIVEVNAEVLAGAFNADKTKLQPNIVTLDDFGSLANVHAILVDNQFFKVFDTLHTVESVRNPQGLYTNYFLHVWQILSLSKFKNAIIFKETPAT